MVNVYDLIIKEAERRKIAYVKDYFPFYISSVGCHIFNMMNQQKEIYVEGGSIPNTRMHIMYVAFPGFGKSFYLKQFLKSEKYSLIKGTKIKSIFEGNMSEAGFTGTIYREEGQKEATIKQGLCKEESNSIVGIEEFSAITNAFKQTYNVGLDTSLLTALDTGDVVKRLGAGKISYHTNLTLWAGVQPARYDLSSGFSRRFIFMTFYPTIADIERYRFARRSIKGVYVNYTALKSLKIAVNMRYSEIFKNLRRVYFGEDFYTELNKMDIMHYDDELFERLAIGYWLMRSDKLKDTLEIRVDPELKRIMALELEYRRDVRKTSPTTIIKRLISTQKKIKKSRIENLAISLGLTAGEISMALSNLEVYKNIKKEGKDIVILKRSS